LLLAGECITSVLVALRWLLMLAMVQGVGFQLIYYWRGPQRDFDSGFVTAFNAATALPTDRSIFNRIKTRHGTSKLTDMEHCAG